MSDDDDKADSAVWDMVAKTVKPLENKEKSLHNSKKKQGTIDGLSGDDEFSKRLNQHDVAAEDMGEFRRDISDAHQKRGRHQDFETGGKEIDRKTDQRLKRGQMPIDAQLDLHGYSKEQAHRRLLAFLQRAYGVGQRCVLVITGKGVQALDGADDPHAPGVLKRSLPGWVQEPPLSEIVLRFYTAQIKDGGAGAYYIYLRRRR